MRILSTPRLHLRTLEESDAPAYLRLLNEPSFIANIGDRGLRTEADALAHMRKGPMEMYAQRGFSLYLAELADGTPIGMCGLIKRDTLDDVDIGYAYFPEFWGKGYAYEAGRAVLDHAHRDIGLQRVAAITSPGNTASIAVLTKLGFEFKKTIQMSDDGTDTNFYLRALPA
ncbi:MAG: GNAT family N-acetyltransferase [Telluria sp.]